MRVDLDVPEGTVLLLLEGEWYPEPGRPARRQILVSSVAVRQQAIGGLVYATGHACNHRDPDCDRHHCWEAQVSVAAVRACLDGTR
ncbi:hypothetical protein [Verrucosispora sp. WMMC514]|uniref:hypothetical protein n=1 Tax=Verrucosispora sp. WMMC514 TaxID=3015156 RepID=UPI00248BF6F3|nr:hypothetical protein [Verrucosispora sp. WMMC514]WBB94161.1 hypothetical protein O7597_15030 [Verrucosispora sp. WMMC514]